MNLNGTEYFYIRNAQSDIIGLVDKTGALVASYVYDTWGKLVSITDTSGVGVGTKNPYRYRGYRYDTESGLYYCNSRYYNPDWGRFLNADGEAGNVGALLSHNMFTYCQNNPINMVDPNGNNPLIGLAIGGLVGGGAATIISYHDTGSINWDKVRDWGINGALIGSGLGELAGARMVMAAGSIEILGRGSTGRTVANNLNEKLAMEEVMSNPLDGATLLKSIRLKDNRWSADDGWVKMSNSVNGTEIHYVYNTVTGAFDDFKFK